MDLMQLLGWASLILGALAGVFAIVVKTAHAMGYEVPVLTRIADGLEQLARLLASRPLVEVRRRAKAGPK